MTTLTSVRAKVLLVPVKILRVVVGINPKIEVNPLITSGAVETSPKSMTAEGPVNNVTPFTLLKLPASERKRSVLPVP